MLAVIAGAGALPAALAARTEPVPLICALSGFAPDGVTPDLTFRLEHLGSVMQDLRGRGVTEICLAGAIRRPALDPAAIDAATLPLIPIMQKAIGAGDDGALRAVIAMFEHAGFTVRGAHEIAPDLLPPAGVHTAAQPSDSDRVDARRGAEIVAALAAADIGQSCAVMAGQALAVEGVFGTDWMLDSLRNRPALQSGGLLFKAPKPGQDRRADLPVIGPATIDRAAGAGLTGVVIEAGGVMVLDQPATWAQADRMGLFVWVREPDA